MTILNALFQKYVFECTFPGCGGRQTTEQPSNAGLALGSMVPEDPSNFLYGRCTKCKRAIMKVIEVPSPPKPQPPKGFTKVPTE